MATYTSNYGWTKPSGSDNVDISVLNNNLDDQDSTIHDAFLNMAPPFSESSTYAVDDIVLYGTTTYKCHTAVVTPGAWTGSTNWQVYKLSEGGGGGTSDYTDLANKPQINGTTLAGNKTASDLGLQEELTFDNVPTDGSNNPVKSDGIYDSEKDIYAVMGQMGAKNLIPYPYYETTKTVNGVTFTDNGDGTISVTGRAEGGDATFVLHTRKQGEIYDFTIPNGNYILSGCPSGGTSSSFYLNIGCTKNGAWSTLGVDLGNGENITCNGDDYSQTSVNPAINIVIKSGYSIAGTLTFKPMLRLASDTDDTYQPYAKTNRELTDEVLTKIPDAPTTDGAYNLSVTVVNGTPTYSWVSTS